MPDPDDIIDDGSGQAARPVVPDEPIDRLRARILSRWRAFPALELEALETLLGEALARAGEAPAEILTVMDPTSRPQRLRLATLVERADLDSFYHNEWAELSVGHDGRLFLVYRRRDGGDYAVTWTPATLVPEPVMQAMPEVLAKAMLEGDDAGEQS